MNKLLLYLIVHILTVCFVVLTPFLGNAYFLLLHSILVPFIMLHWILNDNTCVLTTLEKHFRKKLNGGIDVDTNDCFTCRLIDPIYKFNNNNKNYSNVIYIVTIGLWLISVSKFYCMFSSGKIQSFIDLMRVYN